MKVHILDLKPDLKFDLSGSESWLEPIYKDFALPDSDLPTKDDAPKIVGTILITKLTDDFIHITGQLDYAPFVNCSRCSLPIAWPLSESIDVYYQRRGVEELPKDITLRRGELDEYYFDGQELDLSEVVNDSIQTALTSRYLPADKDDLTCQLCGLNFAETKVYGSASEEEDAEESPFSILKNLKPKH